MKKLMLTVLAFCCLAFSQDKQKVAVYIVNKEPKGSKINYRVLTSKLVESISQGSACLAVDHTVEILNELKKDNRGDIPDEHQIKFIGRMLKAHYFCMLEVTPINPKAKKGDAYSFSVRLVDAATGSVVNSASAAATRDQKDINESVMRLGRQVTRYIEVTKLAAEAQQLSKPEVSAAKVADKPKIAVYVAGGMEENAKRIVAANIIDGLVNSGSYRMIERSDDFLDELTKEQQKQRDGSVDEKQIVSLGRQAGAQFICITDVTSAFGKSQVSARIVDVMTADVVASGVSNVSVDSMDDLIKASAEVVDRLLGKRPRSK
ncbi:MAG: CsgG/HfaB family protein [Chitinispirillales bacterium]|jgi:hypothetical protein|nr:CsgG/HfaB family protein [Chitinispirillales bacterium]